MTRIETFVGKVWCMNALKLLQAMPPASVDAVITDPMYGAHTAYEWGVDPARGDPNKHWLYHEPIYREWRRVVKPGGVLALAQSINFKDHYQGWIGDHFEWVIYRGTGQRYHPNVWLVQTREQRAVVRQTAKVRSAPMGWFKHLHPCIKPVEEMLHVIQTLTRPGQLILDCFCGLGSGLLGAEELGRRWIGCDISRFYCQVAMRRLDELRRLGPERHRLPLKPWFTVNNPQIEAHLKSKPWFVPGGGNQSWQTPPALFEKLNSIFHFTVDAAASKANALLPRYWTVEQDALRQDWSKETVFCNPPFNNIAPFLVKARTARKALVLVWLNFLTSSSFLAQSADSIIIPKGRVKYLTASRRANPYFATCFLLYGKLTRSEAAAITSQGWQYFLNHEAVA